MKRTESTLIIAVPLALLLFVVWFVFIRQDQAGRIREGAEKCARAILARDFATVVGLTQKHLLELNGGKDAIIAKMNDQVTQLHAQSINYDNIIIGEPQPAVKIASWTISLVPELVVLKAPGGKLKEDTYILGMSDDDGKTWSYVSLTMAPELFFKAFPELKDKFVFPEKKAPVYQKDVPK